MHIYTWTYTCLMPLDARRVRAPTLWSWVTDGWELAMWALGTAPAPSTRAGSRVIASQRAIFWAPLFYLLFSFLRQRSTLWPRLALNSRSFVPFPITKGMDHYAELILQVKELTDDFKKSTPLVSALPHESPSCCLPWQTQGRGWRSRNCDTTGKPQSCQEDEPGGRCIGTDTRAELQRTGVSPSCSLLANGL